MWGLADSLSESNAIEAFTEVRRPGREKPEFGGLGSLCSGAGSHEQVVVRRRGNIVTFNRYF